MRNPNDVMAKMLNYGLEVHEFKLQSHYYEHFWTNTLQKVMNPFVEVTALINHNNNNTYELGCPSLASDIYDYITK